MRRKQVINFFKTFILEIYNYESNEGMLYLKLHDLEKQDYITSSWGNDGEKFYRISQIGNNILDTHYKQNHTLFRNLIEE
ncbi:helix-turn-helix transcriptional regulator [Piscibacillus salipiscarius]|uniref:helix-turn-helix transcriptional regulator n=1 Tax=Piscibacillus salipiscarius TaxID=299480 RepID=UPI0034E2875D